MAAGCCRWAHGEVRSATQVHERGVRVVLFAAGPCPFEYHDDHINWSAIQGDYDKQSDREKER